jgi:exodeoxyribonuclease V gamma subunit
MRSIPFKVICLLGLDNDTFPRRQTRKGFDLMTVKPERGDRSRRDDDRYLFLEALVSARETLYISYVGQDQQDNSTRPPSVLVSELLDYLEKTFIPPDAVRREAAKKDNRMSAFLTRVHRLHGFSAAYFIGHGPLFSYSDAQARTATALEQGTAEVRRFITAPLAQGLDQWRVLDIDTLVKFFRHPVRFFLEQRLGLRLPQGEAELENRETFKLTSLARYAAADQILKARLSGLDPLPVLSAQGILPHGMAGLAAFGKVDAAIASLVERIQRYAPCAQARRHALDLACGGYRIIGGLEASGETALIYRPGKIRDKDLIEVWIRHVLLNTRQSISSCVLGCDFDRPEAAVQEVRFRPVDAMPILETLLGLFTQGLQTPLAFYPASSYAFAQAEAEGKDGLAKAISAWEGSEQQPGEGADEAYHFHPGRLDPFQGDFAAHAHAFFTPLLEAKEDEA